MINMTSPLTVSPTVPKMCLKLRAHFYSIDDTFTDSSKLYTTSLGESCIVTFSFKFSDKKTFQKLESKRNKRRIKSASNVGSKLGNFKIRTWLRRRKKKSDISVSFSSKFSVQHRVHFFVTKLTPS